MNTLNYIFDETMRREGKRAALLYGGEEFTVMLPNTLKVDALQVAERIRSNIENANFEYEGKIFPAILEMEICVDCWKKFIKKSKKLFKPNK